MLAAISLFADQGPSITKTIRARILAWSDPERSFFEPAANTGDAASRPKFDTMLLRVDLQEAVRDDEEPPSITPGV